MPHAGLGFQFLRVQVRKPKRKRRSIQRRSQRFQVASNSKRKYQSSGRQGDDVRAEKSSSQSEVNHRCIRRLLQNTEVEQLENSSRCRYRNVRPHSLPAESRSFVGMARETAAMPPAKNPKGSLWFQGLHTHTRTHTRPSSAQRVICCFFSESAGALWHCAPLGHTIARTHRLLQLRLLVGSCKSSVNCM